MIAAPACGVVQWHVSVGQEVIEGELLAEIISVDNVDATPMAIRARCSGLVFARRWHHLVRPGQVVLKIASPEPLAWRKDADQLLTL